MANEIRVLVVDDEAVIRDLMTDILSDEGFIIETAPNGNAALQLLRNYRDFVLLFTDILMPEMNGIELIREARKLAPNIIPIVMTGFGTLETAREAVREGAYDYVLKPFSLSEIKLAVTNAMERHRLLNENTRLRELTELFRISEAIAAFHDERSLLDFVLKASLERVGAKHGSLMLFSGDGRRLEVAASVNGAGTAPGEPIPINETIAKLVAREGRPLLVDDVAAFPELAEHARSFDDTSFMCVPLEGKAHNSQRATRHRKPRVIAVLNVSHKTGDAPFTESDLKTLSIVANHAAAALENVRLIRDVRTAHLATLQSMALLLEAKDAYTHGHSQRVSEYALRIGRKLGLTEGELDALRTGAILHDLGKVGVSDAVLNKQSALTKEEWGDIRKHPVIGYDVLAPVSFLSSELLALVRSHHERLDGTGYPDALKGEGIPRLARILAVADAYDAMSSTRAYREAMSRDQIAEELRRCSGSQLDPAVVDVFLELLHDGTLDITPSADAF